VGYVDCDANLRIDAVCGGLRSAETYLLLNGTHSIEAYIELLFGAQAQDLHRDEESYLIIESRSGDQAVSKIENGEVKGRYISYFYPFFGVFLIFRSDVDPNSIDVIFGFISLVTALRVNRLSSDDTFNWASLCVNGDSRGVQHPDINPSERGYVEVSVVRDVSHHESDLIAVTG
jgi:hypothetical protein